MDLKEAAQAYLAARDAFAKVESQQNTWYAEQTYPIPGDKCREFDLSINFYGIAKEYRTSVENLLAAGEARYESRTDTEGLLVLSYIRDLRKEGLNPHSFLSERVACDLLCTL